MSPSPLRWLLAAILVTATMAAGRADDGDTAAHAPRWTRASLGRALFFDPTLSRRGSQSCATCHDPARAFSDGRDNGVGGAASLGDDGTSLGDRNTPTAMYARFSPPFAVDAKGIARGGQFLDGRAVDLAAQARQPLLNPLEMNMPDAASVVARLAANPAYVIAFEQLYGDGVLARTDDAWQAVGDAIAAYEQGDELAPFDSRYDRYLAGEYTPTAAEELGMTLFFSAQFTNCNLCHQLRPTPAAAQETFSNYEYHNIGVPTNTDLRAANGVGDDFVDAGLLAHPGIDEASANGRFKVPTLRNVAVTAPYMHNGVFRELRTVVAFYNQFNSRAEKNRLNPETGRPWRAPEVPGTLSEEELTTGPALDDRRVDALVAFLRMLTDRRYEALLDDPH